MSVHANVTMKDLLSLADKCSSVLERLSCVDAESAMRREAELSASLSYSSDYGNLSYDHFVSKDNRYKAAKYLCLNKHLTADDIVSCFNIVSGDAYTVTIEQVSPIVHALSMTGLDPIVLAVVIHNKVLQFNIFPAYNDTMARLLVYATLQRTYPGVWMCSLADAIISTSLRLYPNEIANGMEKFLRVMYTMACIALAKQELGIKYDYDAHELLLCRLRWDCEIDDYIKEVKTTCS